MNIPKGYKLVPVEPTEEMLVVMHDRILIGVNSKKREANILNDRAWWTAVVDSAPTPPQPIYDEAKERDLFEEAATSALGRDSEGYYIATDTYLRWQGWLSCAQSRAKAVEVGHG